MQVDSSALSDDAFTVREGNWSHPDGGRIIGWRLMPSEVERLGADAFRLPREAHDWCLEQLRAARATEKSES